MHDRERDKPGPLKKPADISRGTLKLLLLVMAALLSVAVLIPLIELLSLAVRPQGVAGVSLDNFRTYFSSVSLTSSFINTFRMSVVSTVLSVSMAFLYAYALARTPIRGKTFFKYIAMLPIFAPTMMHGIALIYLFGNKGLVTTGFFGVFMKITGVDPSLDIGIYGLTGIILSETVYCFPQAFMILNVALSMTDYRLYEAAETLGAGGIKKFFTITVPGVKYGLVSALFVCFILSFTDFGAPKVIGGGYNVLATDVYQQVVGQQNMSMGSAVGILLLVPAFIAFAVDRIMQRRQKAAMAAGMTMYRVKSNTLRDGLLGVIRWGIALAIIVLMGTVLLASIVKVWPYDLGFTFDHYVFKNVSGGGLGPFLNSITVAVITAVVGTAFTFLNAYLIEKTGLMAAVRQFNYLLSLAPLALPGLVIGISYVLVFNRPEIIIPFTGYALPSPLHFLYGTVALIVLANVVHFYSVPFLTITAALKKLDGNFENVSESLAVPVYISLFRVTVPLTMRALLETGMYFFVNSMVTISAVIFIYSPRFKLASVSIVGMEEAGDTAAAAAMSVLIVLTNLAVWVVYGFVTKRLSMKHRLWERA